MLLDYRKTIKTEFLPIRKTMKKLGTLEIGVVETTPVVWKDELLRFEWVRNSQWGRQENAREVGCYHFVNMKTGACSAEFALDHSFGCCYAENGVMYVHGVAGNGGGQILKNFWSEDLVNWQESVALEFPQDINLYNTSVCKGPDGYVMAIEVGGKNPVVGKNFTIVFI